MSLHTLARHGAGLVILLMLATLSGAPAVAQDASRRSPRPA